MEMWLGPDNLGLLTSIGKLLLTLCLCAPLAYNREQNTNIMGLRTYPLVALGACAYVLIGLEAFNGDSDGARARVLQGMLSGLGFVGGGAILKKKDSIQGTACAASIWITGAIGASVGFGVYHVAVTIALFSFLILRIMPELKDGMGPEDSAST